MPTERSQPAASAVEVVAKRFGTQQVLDGVSFRIAAGESLVVLGPSGSGKTTLLRLIAGLDHVDAGEVRLRGKRANDLTPQARNLGVVFQEHALFQKMTVEENIAFGLKVRGVSAKVTDAIVDEMLDLVQLAPHRK
jgi:ABC-type Fe3+/spermidine/putrescine transport system ATPase subunit